MGTEGSGGACPRLLDAQGDWRPEEGPDDEAEIRRWFAPRVHPEAPGSEREQAFATEALAEANYVLQIRWITVKHLHVYWGGALDLATGGIGRMTPARR